MLLLQQLMVLQLLELLELLELQRQRKVLEIGGALSIDNTVWPYYLCTDGGACISTHTLGGSGGMLPQKNFLN